MIYANSPQSDINSFPSDWIDPAKKAQPEYSLQYAKAAYEMFLKDKCLISTSRRQDFITNRLYAEGVQNNLKYKKWTAQKNEQGQWESFVDLDYSPVSDIPKYRDIVMGLMEKRSYDITVTAIDPYSDKERMSIKFDMWAKKTLNDILEKEQIMLEAGIEEEMLPQTKEELQIFEQMGGIKLPAETAIESALEYLFYINGWNEIAKKVRQDLFDNGIAATREYVDKNGQHKIRYVDVVNLLAVNTRDSEFKDSTWAGEIVEMTLSDLVSEAGDSFTPEEYRIIANKFVDKYGTQEIPLQGFVDTDSDQFRNYNFLDRYGNYKIQVLDLTWFTVDEKYYQRREAKDGTMMTYDAPYGFEITEYEYTKEGNLYYRKRKGSFDREPISEKVYAQGIKKQKYGKKREVAKSAVKMVYGCKWIVGSDYVYDYGKTTDMPREKHNERETKLPYNIYRLSNKSYVERMMPFVDMYMRSWMKLQNAVAKARPKGILVELGALENMTIDGKTFTPLQILELHDATGNLLYKEQGTYGEPGNTGRSKPVQELQNGLGSEFSEHISVMNYSVQKIREVTGFNEAFDASTPDPKQSVRGAQLAVNATSNALQPLMSAYENIHERTARSAGLRIQIMSKYKSLKGFDRAISDTKLKIIEITSDLSMMSMGIKIESRPTEEQKIELKNAALQAMNARNAQGVPQITYSDYLFINRVMEGGNIQMAEAVLAYRIQKREEQQQAIAEKNSEMNAQIQERSMQAKAQADQQSMAMQSEIKLAEINAQANAQIMIDNNKLEKQKEIEMAKTQGKMAASSNKDETDIKKKLIESNTVITKEKIKGGTK